MMKKNLQYAWLSAIALTSAVVFTGCSSDDDAVNNPNYDPQTDAVKTSFTISVGDVKQNTRMNDASVQADNQFRGMQDIYLIPAKTAITGTTAFAEDVINLTNFTTFDKKPTTNAKIYNDVKLSVGVNNFLFYAANPQKDNGELRPSYLKVDKTAFNGAADWAASLVFNGNKTVGDITFDLVPYQKDKAIAYVETQGADVVKVLNDIDAALTTAIGANNSSKTLLQAKQNIMRNFEDTDNDGEQDAGETTYQAFAGSALSIKALAEDMYNFAKNLGTDGNDICTAITNAGLSASGDDASGYTLSWTNTFPAGLNLPDGAVAVKWDGSKFAYTDDVNIVGLTSPTISTYTHPARLYYTINTPAMVKPATYLETLTGNEEWSDVQTEYIEGAITALTKSVIMKDQVQYAVGRLDVQVKVNNTVNLKDNGSGIDNTSDKDPQLVSVPSNGYTITGILIGGQKQVDWQFKPVTAATEMTIWDNSITANTAAKPDGTYTTATHTLALETAENTPVNIAVEFTNEGNDFYGYNHKLIPHGTKFYLVAQLNPSSNKENDNSLTQVFKQDYTTTAQLTIGENSLKSAYNVIPDLRSPKLEFGFSVNLEWQTGIVFEQEFQ